MLLCPCRASRFCNRREAGCRGWSERGGSVVPAAVAAAVTAAAAKANVSGVSQGPVTPRRQDVGGGVGGVAAQALQQFHSNRYRHERWGGLS
jgi:hypothetical protein